MSDGTKIEWTKPSGLKITTNALPATMTYCASIGWKPAEEDAPKPKAKKPAK